LEEKAPANIVVLFGPPAVGKTAVGRELAELTGYTLYHGHLTMDVISDFFPFGTASFLRLHRLFTHQILEEAAEQRLSIILTIGWQFATPTDTAANISVTEPFLARGGRAFHVELWAPLAVRLERNRTEERQRSKKTDWSTDEFLTWQEANDARDSGGRLPLDLPFLRLETGEMPAREAAEAVWAYVRGVNAPQARP
jgi:hypothetical protein